MTSREAFLQRVRDAVGEGNRAGMPREPSPRGRLGYQEAGPDPVQTFTEQLAALGGFCHAVSGADEAKAKVLQLLRAANARQVLVSKGLPEELNLAAALRAERFEVWDESASIRDEKTKEILFAADAGVTGVDWLIAETGTMVVTTSEGKGRSLSLLPPLHIALATRDQLLPDLFDLFELFSPLSPLGEGGEGWNSLPACITLITGPSKTGDIELRLVTGVHGPGEVHVVLMG